VAEHDVARDLRVRRLRIARGTRRRDQVAGVTVDDDATLLAIDDGVVRDRDVAAVEAHVDRETALIAVTGRIAHALDAAVFDHGASRLQADADRADRSAGERVDQRVVAVDREPGQASTRGVLDPHRGVDRAIAAAGRQVGAREDHGAPERRPNGRRLRAGADDGDVLAEEVDLFDVRAGGDLDGVVRSGGRDPFLNGVEGIGEGAGFDSDECRVDVDRRGDGERRQPEDDGTAKARGCATC
jgi:hypothetical protein